MASLSETGTWATQTGYQFTSEDHAAMAGIYSTKKTVAGAVLGAAAGVALSLPRMRTVLMTIDPSRWRDQTLLHIVQNFREVRRYPQAIAQSGVITNVLIGGMFGSSLADLYPPLDQKVQPLMKLNTPFGAQYRAILTATQEKRASQKLAQVTENAGQPSPSSPAASLPVPPQYPKEQQHTSGAATNKYGDEVYPDYRQQQQQPREYASVNQYGDTVYTDAPAAGGDVYSGSPQRQQQQQQGYSYPSNNNNNNHNKYNSMTTSTRNDQESYDDYNTNNNANGESGAGLGGNVQDSAEARRRAELLQRRRVARRQENKGDFYDESEFNYDAGITNPQEAGSGGFYGTSPGNQRPAPDRNSTGWRSF
eukprot:TRINITY_DN5139_c0_g1_i1.p1 TRINITY_DN5139_c0_g1~~TRINITY_DN5139_c0_g1_i1.p1  ORF type:complete len:374 (-),score=87.79 TRINITY_DN5139_c0_g1_i1:44-1138(-)